MSYRIGIRAFLSLTLVGVLAGGVVTTSAQAQEVPAAAVLSGAQTQDSFIDACLEFAAPQGCSPSSDAVGASEAAAPSDDASDGMDEEAGLDEAFPVTSTDGVGVVDAQAGLSGDAPVSGDAPLSDTAAADVAPATDVPAPAPACSAAGSASTDPAVAGACPSGEGDPAEGLDAGAADAAKAGEDETAAAPVAKPAPADDAERSAKAEPAAAKPAPVAKSAPAAKPAPADDAERSAKAEPAAAKAAAKPAPAAEAAAARDGWVTEGGKTYYYRQGRRLTGAQSIDGAWYYLDPAGDGALATGERELDGAWYYFDPARGGARAQGELVTLDGAANKLAGGVSKTVYYDGDGRMHYGELELGGAWRYFKPGSGAEARGECVYLDGAANGLAGGVSKVVYYDDDGSMHYGELYCGGSWYYMHPLSGARAEDEFVYLDGAANNLAGGVSKTTFYDELGRMVYGEREVKGKWYNFASGSGAMSTGFQLLTYPYLATGPKLVYYDPKTGAMTYGNRVVSGESFWFDRQSGATSLVHYLDWALNQAPSSGMFGTERAAGSAEVNALTRAALRVEQLGYELGYLMIDISSGSGICHNADANFYSASTVKGPYVASLYRYVFGDSGTASAYYDVLHDTIAYSDNDAYALLRATFGSGSLDRLFADSDANYVADGIYARYTTRNVAKVWASMYDYFTHDGTGFDCSLLFRQPNVSAIRAELGQRWLTNTKAGWYPTDPGYTTTADAGIIYAGSRPYIMAIFCDAPEQFDLIRPIVRALDAVHDALR